ncbi:hypothetical protein EOD42_25580 [Rhodovarius crocodyli]|uniref:Uncharacterized protein n=2 Tax=Rhodovarius crocodyli TaxID=1979269 RepID=A0A437LV17_9PROT|nr:hypothetical protein EOD42_25580 [Rhodovarius crocodyli]
MGRHRKPDALSNAEHQRNHVARHGLKLIRVTPAVHEALHAACKRTGDPISRVLLDALQALSMRLDQQAKEVALAKLEATPPAPTKPRRKRARPPKINAPDLFSGE